MSRLKTYCELEMYLTFDERYRYLRLNGMVGNQTFGFDRWINQRFYKSHEWQTVRDFVIVRDNGCDLGIIGYEIRSELLIHHMNPVSLDDITGGRDWILDPDFLITTSLATHNAIHYGDENYSREPIVRQSGDTKLW